MDDLTDTHGSYDGPFGFANSPRRQERQVRRALEQADQAGALNMGDGNTDPDHPSVQLPLDVAKRLCQKRRP